MLQLHNPHYDRLRKSLRSDKTRKALDALIDALWEGGSKGVRRCALKKIFVGPSNLYTNEIELDRSLKKLLGIGIVINDWRFETTKRSSKVKKMENSYYLLNWETIFKNLTYPEMEERDPEFGYEVLRRKLWRACEIGIEAYTMLGKTEADFWQEYKERTTWLRLWIEIIGAEPTEADKRDLASPNSERTMTIMPSEWSKSPI
jgi:hypothetical protein